MKEMKVLEKLYANEDVHEIIVDRFDDVYWDQGGELKESETLLRNEEEIYEVIDSLLELVGRDRDSVENGFADLRLPDGNRVAITLPPISLNGPAILIRKFPRQKVTPADIIKWKAVDENGWKICEKLLANNTNILLAGNAGCGKTTTANMLVDAIPKAYRVVTVEKTATLVTDGRKRTLRLETPNAKQHEMKDLLVKAGYLRADYLVIHDLNGSEAFETINYMRAGYSVIAAATAEGVRDALKKMEIFCMMDSLNISPTEIKYHVGTGVGAVIFQERRPDGSRKISNISLVEGLDENNEYILKPLFFYDEDTDSFVTTDAGVDYLS